MFFKYNDGLVRHAQARCLLGAYLYWLLLWGICGCICGFASCTYICNWRSLLISIDAVLVHNIWSKCGFIILIVLMCYYLVRLSGQVIVRICVCVLNVEWDHHELGPTMMACWWWVVGAHWSNIDTPLVFFKMGSFGPLEYEYHPMKGHRDMTKSRDVYSSVASCWV